MSSGPQDRHALLFIASMEFGGGAEGAVATLADQLRGAGWRVSVATLYDTEHETAVDGHRRIRRSAPEPRGPLTVVRKVLAGAGHVRWLRRVLASERPAVCISFLEEANFLAIDAARAAGVPVVATVHISPASYPALVRRRMRRSYRNADAVVAVAQAMAAELQARCGVAGAEVIPNAIHLERIRSAASADVEPSLAIDSTTVLHVGRQVPIKDQHLLLRAFAEARASRPDLRLTMVGDGPERGALEHEATRLELGNAVSFLGLRSDVPALMARAGCVALSSRVEGFSLVVAEAIALGTPVVTTDCAGPRELLGMVDEVAGVIVPLPRMAGGDAVSITAFANGILTALERRGTLRAPDSLPFDHDAVAKSWVTLVERIARPASPARARRDSVSS